MNILVNGIEYDKKAVAEKDVTAAIIFVDDNKTEKKDSLNHLHTMVDFIVDKTGEIKISDDAKGVEWDETTVAEKDVSVKGVEYDKKAVAEKDVIESVIPVNDSKKEEKVLLIF